MDIRRGERFLGCSMHVIKQLRTEIPVLVNRAYAIENKIVVISGLSSIWQWAPEMIIIRVAGWISGRIVSLQPDPDIQKLLSNKNRMRIRISETLLSMFR